LFLLSKQRFDLLLHFSNWGIHFARQMADAVGLPSGFLISLQPRHCLDAANARRNGRLSQDSKQANFPSCARMRPSAQLHGVAVQLPGFAADLHHAHDLAVLVAEKLHYIFTILHAWIWNLGPGDWGIFQKALV